MTITTAAPAVNAFEVSHSTCDRWHTVTDVRTGKVVKTFFWEDNEKFGIASVRARALSDSLWYAELTAAPEVAPEVPVSLTIEVFATPASADCAMRIYAEHDTMRDAAARIAQAQVFYFPQGYGFRWRATDARSGCDLVIGQGECWPPEPEPSADTALAPSMIVIASPDQIPAALVAAAWGLAPDCQHAINTGRQWLLTFKERPDLWRTLWRKFSESEQGAVLAGARLAGATPCELNALAGVHSAVVMARAA